MLLRDKENRLCSSSYFPPPAIFEQDGEPYKILTASFCSLQGEGGRVHAPREMDGKTGRKVIKGNFKFKVLNYIKEAEKKFEKG